MDDSIYPRSRPSIDDALRDPGVPGRSATEREGQILGEFRIESLIHRGKITEIYRADSTLEASREVALKVLHRDASRRTWEAERFRTEAALVERVRHPSILPSLGAGFDQGCFYYAMRLASGRHLGRASFFPPPRDADYYTELASRFATLCKGVSALHEAGVVHRNIKPSVIHLDAEGCFVLTGFGRAVDRLDPGLLAAPGSALRYASPEQVRPDADPCDPATDIYSLGAVLYEMATGRAAFPDRESHELARLKLIRRPVPPRQLNPHLPLSLEAIIRQALRFDPHERQSSAEVLARELECFGRQKRSHRR